MLHTVRNILNGLYILMILAAPKLHWGGEVIVPVTMIAAVCLYFAKSFLKVHPDWMEGEDLKQSLTELLILVLDVGGWLLAVYLFIKWVGSFLLG